MGSKSVTSFLLSLLTLKFWKDESLVHLFEMEIEVFFPLFIVVLQCRVSEQELDLLCAWNVTHQVLSRLVEMRPSQLSLFKTALFFPWFYLDNLMLSGFVFFFRNKSLLLFLLGYY